MSKSRIYTLVLVVLLLVAATFYVIKDKTFISEEDVVYGLFLKELQGNVDNVSTVVVGHGGKQLKVKRVDGIWVLPRKYNYPVELEKIRNIAVNAESLDIIEKKTNDPARLGVLGLDSPDTEGSSSSRIVLMDATEEKIFADFIRGNSRRSGGVSDFNAIYVRNSNDNQGWLVRGDFDIKLDANTLLNKKVFRIPGVRIKEVMFGHPVSKDFVLSRRGFDKDFKMTEPKKDVKDPVSVNRLATMLEASLVFSDVVPEAQMSFEGKSVFTTSFKTFDGFEMFIETLSVDGDEWIRLRADGSNEASKAEAEKVNAIAKDWVYKVSDVTGAMLKTELESLVE